MTEEPRSLTSQRRSVPPNVEAAVSKALQKVPADRFASAREFAEALNDASFAACSTVMSNERDDSRRLRRMLYGASALAILFFAAWLWGWMRPAPQKQVVRYNMAFDSAEAMAPGDEFSGRFAISLDGLHVAYVRGASAQILVRLRSELHGTPVPGSEGAVTPFFSPDGKSVGFLRSGSLEFAAVSGGPPIKVTDTLVERAGASWGRDGFIYVDALKGGLLRVEARAGGVPRTFTVLDSAKGEIDHMWPDVLPNGKGVICTIAFRDKHSGNGTSFAIGEADIPSGKVHVLVNGAMHGVYAASGHLLYVTPNRTLMMVPFDQNSMKITGDPTPLVEGIRAGSYGAADFAVSETGTLMYATGAGTSKQELLWVTRDRKVQSVDPDWQGQFAQPVISPDGKELAITRSTGPNGVDIWIKQLDRGPSTKLTLEGSYNVWPAWTPDGRSVTYASDAGQSATYAVWTRRADGSSQPVLQLREKRDLYPVGWSPDGKSLILNTSEGAGDILLIRPGVDTVPVPLVATEFSEYYPQLSRDGRWLAYQSNESGQFEVYVVPFPNTRAAKWAVSTSGGSNPEWSNTGKELFYIDEKENLVAVDVRTTPTFSVGRSTTLFRAGEFRDVAGFIGYAVARDDRRFLMLRSVAADTPDKLIVVDNWFEELRGKSRK